MTSLLVLGAMNYMVAQYTQVPSHHAKTPLTPPTQNRTPFPPRRQPPLFLLHLAPRIQVPLEREIPPDAGVPRLRLVLALEDR